MSFRLLCKALYHSQFLYTGVGKGPVTITFKLSGMTDTVYIYLDHCNCSDTCSSIFEIHV